MDYNTPIPPWLNFQEIIVSITTETLYKYRIDFNFSSQLAPEIGSSCSSHLMLDLLAARTLPQSISQLRVGKFMRVFLPGLNSIRSKMAECELKRQEKLLFGALIEAFVVSVFYWGGFKGLL